MRNRYSVTFAKAGTETWEDITDCIDISQNNAIKTTIDTFQFSISARSGYNSKFNIDDKVKIYFWSGDGARPDTPVISGLISSITLNHNVDSKMWLIRGENRLERLLHTLLPVPTASKTPPEWIKDFLDKTNKYSLKGTDKKIKYIYDGVDQDGAADSPDTITKTKSNETSFDAVSYFVLMDKPIFEMIEELSGTKYTNDSYPYIYYLDSSDYFHWEYRKTVYSNIINSTDFLEYGVEKGVYDIINGVIMVGGRDFNGAIIKDYAVDFSAISKGIRWKFVVPEEDIALEIKRANNVTIDNDYPYGKAADYGNNDDFRAEVHAEIRKRAGELVRQKGKAQYKVSGKMHGTTIYAVGDMIRVNITGVFFDASDTAVTYKDLRLEKVEHSFDARNGWITKLELVEDVIAAVG